MQWFVFVWLSTAYWGNGAVDTDRTAWVGVFYGPLEVCLSIADSMEVADRALIASKGQPFDPTYRHPTRPQKFQGGITVISGVTYSCVPFKSRKRIQEAFPLDWKDMTGCRYTEANKCEGFDWWEAE